MLYLRFCIALEALPLVMYRRRNLILWNSKNGVWEKWTNKPRDGHRNSRALQRNVYISKLPITHTPTSFTIEMHASPVNAVHALPLMQSDLFQNSFSRWSSDPKKEFWFCFLPCHSILFVFLFHNCLTALKCRANFYFIYLFIVVLVSALQSTSYGDNFSKVPSYISLWHTQVWTCCMFSECVGHTS